jgi:hypothetical protein
LAEDVALLQDEWQPLRFYFSIKDSLFFNYTDLEGFELQRSLLFISNSLNTSLSQSGNVTLHEGEYIDDKSISSIQYDNKISYKNPNGSDPKISDELGNLIELNQYSKMKNAPDEGNFSIIVEDKIHNHYIFQQRFFKVPELIFSLYPAKLLEHYQGNNPVSYQVKFQARSTKWKYILADPAYKRYLSLGIKDFKNDTFPFIEKELMVNGIGKTRVFESKEAISLRDAYSRELQLIENPELEPKKRNIIIKSLPSASPDTIYQVAEFPKEFYSHIFI